MWRLYPAVTQGFGTDALLRDRLMDCAVCVQSRWHPLPALKFGAVVRNIRLWQPARSTEGTEEGPCYTIVLKDSLAGA